MAQSFQEFIKSDRKRLNGERKAVVAQQREVEKKLAAIDQELAAIVAYQSTKTGKAAAIQPAPKARRAASKTRKSTRAPQGSRRESIIAALKGAADGMSRGELLEKMGLKGDKSGEMSVSNALTALSKSKQVARQEGKYVLAAS